MERKRLQQQKMKQQQRFCISQQDLTETIARMKPRRRATYNNLMNVLSSSSSSSLLSCSRDTLTVPSVSQLIKEFEARTVATPFTSAQDVTPTNKNNICNEPEASGVLEKISASTIEAKVTTSDDNNISCLSNDNDQTPKEKVHHQNQPNGDKEPIDQTLDIDRCKRELQSSASSSYNSVENNSLVIMGSRNIDAQSSKRNDKRFEELIDKEIQLNNALADLISLSNDADISSSMSSSSRSLANICQRGRASSTHDRTNSISASIALLNNLLETFDIDNEEYGKKNSKTTTNDQTIQKSDTTKPINMFCLFTTDNMCANCHQSFAANEQIVNAAGKIWHTQCFVCAQCFQPFERGIYFEYEGRKYCERDFQMLFAPFCAECKQAIVGRIIRALQKCYHPDCFRCQSCRIALVEIGFSKSNGRAFCRDCHAKEKQKDMFASKMICSSCQETIEHKFIKYKGEFYHAYHFQCSSCRIELDENAREIRGLLYCVQCQSKVDLPICAACRYLIDDRVINALGKLWHVEHFCCTRCAQPFLGSKHFENKGLAYCETDYHILFGSTCFICNRTLKDQAYTACHKKYCAEHFACSKCEVKMNEKSKFYDVDATPVCKQCFGKLPSDIRKSLQQDQKKKLLSPIINQTTVL